VHAPGVVRVGRRSPERSRTARRSVPSVVPTRYFWHAANAASQRSFGGPNLGVSEDRPRRANFIACGDPENPSVSARPMCRLQYQADPFASSDAAHGRSSRRSASAWESHFLDALASDAFEASTDGPAKIFAGPVTERRTSTLARPATIPKNYRDRACIEVGGLVERTLRAHGDGKKIIGRAVSVKTCGESEPGRRRGCAV
jgi:hypothetical protein